MPVLGIESSCDETAVAVYCPQRGVLAEALHSQVELHARYGGVVPELASRDHVRFLPRLYKQAMDAAGLTLADIDAIGYTAGPGLVGALLAGAAFASGLARGSGRPLIPVHHMEGHLLAPMLSDDPPAFPFVALLVSGGHTMLVDCQSVGRYRVLGQTLDDAAGEAFDKTASLLGLPYPGGPQLAALAEQGEAGRFELPRPMLRQRGLDFSFSGLKTAVALKVRDEVHDDRDRADLAAEFQQAVVDTLVRKCLWALDKAGASELVVAGGVAANRKLRATLTEAVAKSGGRVCFPAPGLCTDNGAMIAHAASLRAADAGWESPVAARWSLNTLKEPGQA